MAAFLILAVVGATSLGSYFVARRWLRLRPSAFCGAWARALECMGLTLVFLAANLAVGVLLVLGYRGLTGRFLTIYAINDITLVLLSILQAILLRWWWESIG
ncbi:MAG: hypothetical protein WAP47_14500 [Candidatus Rokuibacteriota bacterium]